MSKFKLTKAGRAVIGVVLAAAVALGVVCSIKSGLIKFDNKKPAASSKPTAQTVTSTSDDNTINLSLDEWAG